MYHNTREAFAVPFSHYCQEMIEIANDFI